MEKTYDLETLLEMAQSSNPRYKYSALDYLFKHQNVDDIDLLDRDPHMYPHRYTLYGYQQGDKILIWGHHENLKTSEIVPAEVEPELVDADDLDAWIDDHIANINGVSAHPCKNTEFYCNDRECERLRQQVQDISSDHAAGIVAAVRHRFLTTDPAELLDGVRAELIRASQESTIALLQEQNDMLNRLLYQ